MLTINQLSSGILQNIHLHLTTSDWVAVVGASGSGKTTLLNAIAGYIPYQGDIILNGENINTLPAWKRNCRYLNQRLYLFPHKTVSGNLALAQKTPSKHAQIELLHQLNIAHLIDRYPHQLSGGEQQRVALARVLIGKPDLLLLDEPFSSLDWDTRKHLWAILKQLKHTFSISTLIVTHEPKEADYLTERQLYLEHGKQRCSP